MALRPFLEEALLDRNLAGGFDALTSVAEDIPVEQGYVTITYRNKEVNDLRASFTFESSGGRIGGTELALPPTGDVSRSVTAGATFHLNPSPSGIAVGTLKLVRHESMNVMLPGVEVAGVKLWAGQGPPAEASLEIDHPTMPYTFQVETAQPSDLARANALLRHVNAHRSYYLGVVAEAALSLPSLRTDAAVPGGPLAEVDANLWRLPLIGFEGSTALVAEVIEDPMSVDEVTRILGREPGAGTLVQVLADGEYGEILEGALSLASLDALHPALKQLGVPQWADLPPPPNPLEAAALLGDTIDPTGAAARTGDSVRDRASQAANGATGAARGVLQ